MNLSTIIIVVSFHWLGSEIALTRMKHSQPMDAQFDKFSIRRLWITIVVSVTLGVLVGVQRIGHSIHTWHLLNGRPRNLRLPPAARVIRLPPFRPLLSLPADTHARIANRR